ncbi:MULTISPECIES: DsbA family protein [Microbacterium]|uniref:Protein-disulfide isomerase n=2 Tax=Microbacterium TaxID=33882 RepID=A0A7Z7CWA3_9MICO|nr:MULTISPECIES: thioredoxin domain-containing protein [Microbacterium]SFI30266.1 Protein-disulfide isomerase [Microbacterium saccharophilum]
MKTPVKVTLITVAVVVALILAAVIYVLVNQRSTPSPGGEGERASVVRPNSHVLDDGGEGAVTVVEFLDFECEACGAFYPIVEDIREKFAGQITYVVRYFPLPGHTNSTNAALAAEAAAGQDRFEDMYHRLFETQAEWGESQESRADLFRGFAEELGLDMAAYDAAIADPETLARVEMDLNEGQALGVSSTPTFFVEGEPLELQQWNDLEDAITQALSTAE